MNETKMRVLLEEIQRAASTGNLRLARDLASFGLTVLNGTQAEAEQAWGEIQRMIDRPLSMAWIS